MFAIRIRNSLGRHGPCHSEWLRKLDEGESESLPRPGPSILYNDGYGLLEHRLDRTLYILDSFG